MTNNNQKSNTDKVNLPLFYMRYPQKILDWMNRERKHNLQLSHLTEKGELLYWLVDWEVHICYVSDAIRYDEERKMWMPYKKSQAEKREEQRIKQEQAIKEYNLWIKEIPEWKALCKHCNRIVGRNTNYIIHLDMCKRCDYRRS